MRPLIIINEMGICREDNPEYPWDWMYEHDWTLSIGPGEHTYLCAPITRTYRETDTVFVWHISLQMPSTFQGIDTSAFYKELELIPQVITRCKLEGGGKREQKVLFQLEPDQKHHVHSINSALKVCGDKMLEDERLADGILQRLSRIEKLSPTSPHYNSDKGSLWKEIEFLSERMDKSGLQGSVLDGQVTRLRPALEALEPLFYTRRKE